MAESAEMSVSATTNQHSTSTVDNSSGEVHRVAIRVPPFWANKPELWFQQLEAQFHLNAITADTTKFWHVVAQLEGRYAELVEDIIVNPPSTGKYDSVKAELVKRLSTSRQQKLRQLLELEEMGDRTPSQFLRDLRKLAGTAVQAEFLRSLWLNRLPSQMQAILCTQTDLSLEKQAEIADAIKETSSSPQLAATAAQTGSTASGNVAVPPTSAIDLLTAQVSKLAAEVNELARGRPMRHDRHRSSSRRRRSLSRDSDEFTNGECWYHRIFGSNARRCRSPCTRAQTGNGKILH